MRLSLISVVVLTAFGACSKSKSLPPRPIPGTAHVQGTVHTDEVLAAWRNSGLATDDFAPLDPPPDSAAFCEHGLVRGVDTTVCEYASEDTISRGVQQVKADWSRLDTHTGVVLRTKRTTMVVVDRERREPSGKTISQMTKIFSKL